MPRFPFLSAAPALALLSLFSLVGCSRAQKAEAPAATPPALPSAEAVPVETNPAPPPAEAAAPAPNDAMLYAAAPHPVGETNNPDAVIRSPVPAPANSGATLHLLLPEGQNPAGFADELRGALGALGAKVEVKTYATDAEAVADIEGEAAPDLASISDRAAATLIAKGALRPLPAEATAGLAEPAPEFLHHYFDPKSVYTWPYGYTLLGIACWPETPAGNAAAPAAPALQTWRQLADKPVNLPDDKDLRAALWALAEAKPALFDTPPESWQKAEPLGVLGNPKFVVDALPRLRALETSGNGPHPRLVLPTEGSLIFLSHWAIPAAAPVQVPLAQAAFRALADPAHAARFASENGLAVTQPAAKALVPPSLLSDATLYPPETVLALCRFVRAPLAVPAPPPASTPGVTATVAPASPAK